MVSLDAPAFSRKLDPYKAFATDTSSHPFRVQQHDVQDAAALNASSFVMGAKINGTSWRDIGSPSRFSFEAKDPSMFSKQQWLPVDEPSTDVGYSWLNSTCQTFGSPTRIPMSCSAATAAVLSAPSMSHIPEDIWRDTMAQLILKLQDGSPTKQRDEEVAEAEGRLAALEESAAASLAREASARAALDEEARQLDEERQTLEDLASRCELRALGAERSAQDAVVNAKWLQGCLEESWAAERVLRLGQRGRNSIRRLQRGSEAADDSSCTSERDSQCSSSSSSSPVKGGRYLEADTSDTEAVRGDASKAKASLRAAEALAKRYRQKALTAEAASERAERAEAEASAKASAAEVEIQRRIASMEAELKARTTLMEAEMKASLMTAEAEARNRALAAEAAAARITAEASSEISSARAIMQEAQEAKVIAVARIRALEADQDMELKQNQLKAEAEVEHRRKAQEREESLEAAVRSAERRAQARLVDANVTAESAEAQSKARCVEAERAADMAVRRAQTRVQAAELARQERVQRAELAAERDEASASAAWSSLVSELPEGLQQRMLDAELALQHGHRIGDKVDGMLAADALRRAREVHAQLEAEPRGGRPIAAALVVTWAVQLAMALDGLLRMSAFPTPLNTSSTRLLSSSPVSGSASGSAGPLPSLPPFPLQRSQGEVDTLSSVELGGPPFTFGPRHVIGHASNEISDITWIQQSHAEVNRSWSEARKDVESHSSTEMQERLQQQKEQEVLKSKQLEQDQELLQQREQLRALQKQLQEQQYLLREQKERLSEASTQRFTLGDRVGEMKDQRDKVYADQRGHEVEEPTMMSLLVPVAGVAGESTIEDDVSDSTYSDGLSRFLAGPPEAALPISIGEVQRSVALDRARLQEEIKTLKLQRKLQRNKELSVLSINSSPQRRPLYELREVHALPASDLRNESHDRSWPSPVSPSPGPRRFQQGNVSPSPNGYGQRHSASPAPLSRSASNQRPGSRSASPMRPQPQTAARMSSASPAPEYRASKVHLGQASPLALAAAAQRWASGPSARASTPPPPRNSRPASPSRPLQPMGSSSGPCLRGAVRSVGNSLPVRSVPNLRAGAAASTSVLPRGPFSPVRASHSVWRPPIA